MTEIRDATQADLDYCRENALNDSGKNYSNYPLSGWAKTVIINGEIVGVGGVIQYWTGVGEAWFQLSKFAGEHKIESIRCIRRLMEQAFEELELWRIQTTEREDFPQTMKMAEHLGFKKEGLMINYAPDGGNVWLYAIIREVKIEV